MPKDTKQSDDLHSATSTPILRMPTAEDGAGIWELIRECSPLDENSRYCNLVQADHFSETCVVAERDGELVGWISGHMIPGDDALFVWQVAVSPKARGTGLGGKMLRHLVRRDVCRDAKMMKTTITEDNAASWAMFRSFARSIGGELTDEPHFEEEVHFDGEASTEHMVSITLPQARAGLRAVA